jgi:hypothetical protein
VPKPLNAFCAALIPLSLKVVIIGMLIAII